MNHEFSHLRDLPLWIKGPSDKPVPQAQLMEIAESLDLTLLFFDRCREYIRQVLQQLRALRVQPDSAFLNTLSEDQVDALVARPFRTRSEAELRQVRLELLAANPVAIDQMFERLASEPLSDEWLDIHDAECDRIARRDGIGWVDVEATAAKLGIELDSADLTCADTARGEEVSDDNAAARHGGLAETDLSANPTKRMPCVLLLDTSESMGESQGGRGSPIDLLNEAVRALQSALLADSTASSTVDLAVVTFGGGPKEMVPFMPVSSFVPPVLSCAGSGPLGQAVIVALDIIERRKQEYRANGVPYFRPLLFIVTDGQPTDSAGDWSNATQRAVQSRQQRTVDIVAFSTDASPSAISKLQQLTDKTVSLDGFAYHEAFSFLSSSLMKVGHSNEGHEIAVSPVPHQIVQKPGSQTSHMPIRPLVFRWHIAADDAEHIRWSQGAAQDSHALHLDVQVTADSADQLSVILGGIGYVDGGCRVSAFWLDPENNVIAEASVQDSDQPLVLDNSRTSYRKALSPLHRLELRFERSSPTCLSFTASIPLHEPPRSAK